MLRLQSLGDRVGFRALTSGMGGGGLGWRAQGDRNAWTACWLSSYVSSSVD